MGCKKKKLKVRKYTKGGTLAKLETGSYLDTNSKLFGTNDASWSSLTANTQSKSNFSLTDVNKNIDNNYLGTSKGSDSSFNLNSVGKYAGSAGAANSAINAFDDGTMTGAETQNVVDQVGSNFAFYSLGKTVDEAIIPKDENGLYGSDLEASLSYGLTDPAQQLSQSVNDFNEGEYLQSIIDFSMPGLAGIEYQNDQKKAVKEEERKQKEAEMNLKNKNIMENINSNQIDYALIARKGGYLKKYNNGGNMNEPIPSAGFNPIPRSRPQDIDYNIKIYNEYPYNPIPLTGNSSIDEAVTVLGYDRNKVKKDPNAAYNEVVRLHPEHYMIGKDSVGAINLIKKEKIRGSVPHQKTINTPIVRDPNILNSTIQNTNMTIKREGGLLNQNKMLVKKPIVRKYSGQTHEGPNEGIPVDSNGNPSIMTGGKTIGLTEKNEVVYNGYVFSDVIKYKNRNKNKRR